MRAAAVALVAAALMGTACGSGRDPTVSSATTAGSSIPTGGTPTSAATSPSPDACQPRAARAGERTVAAGEGITALVPAGWDVRAVGPAPATPTEWPAPAVHAGNFPLPDTAGATFGGPATDAMAASGVFVALVEYGPDSAGQPLFASQGLPCPPPRCYRAEVGNPPRPGQAGCQAFFTVAGRPFSLLAVVGSAEGREQLAPLVSDFLAGVTIAPRR